MESMVDRVSGPPGGAGGASGASGIAAASSAGVSYHAQSAIAPTLIPSSSEPGGADPLAVLREAVSSKLKARVPHATVEQFYSALKSLPLAATEVGEMAQWWEYVNLVVEYARLDLGAAHAYHFYVYEAHLRGKHDILAEGGHYHPFAWQKFIFPVMREAKSARPSWTASRSSSKDSKRKGSGSTAEHAAGSCVYHPTSTTHTTATCRSGKKQRTTADN